MGTAASLRYLGVPLAVILVDQASKWGVAQVAPVTIGPLGLAVVINTSGAFSLPLPAILLSSVWLILVGYLVVKLRPTKARAALLLIVGGGISNLVDRLSVGGVRDIASLGDLLFNVADITIVGGAVAAVILLARRK